MLDDDELPESELAAAAFRCRPQFWDGGKKLGAEISHALGVDGWVAWDIYLFYPAGVEWTDRMPKPAAALAQTGGVVVAMKGTLPAVDLKGDLPREILPAIDVVGAQSDIDDILARVAAPFIRR